MRRPSLGAGLFVLALSFGFLADVPGVALAHGSTTEQVIRTLNRNLILVATVIAIIVEGVLAVAIWRSWRRADAKPTGENRRLELGWTIATAVVLLYVGTVGFQAMASPAVTTTSTVDERGEALEVEVVGQQWFWTFHYPEQNVTSDVLVLPTDRRVVLEVTSRDVIHSMHVPGLGLKKDAMPGQWNAIRTELTERGSYRFYCAEFCGVNHSDMTTQVHVVSSAQFQSWLAEQRNGSSASKRTITESPTDQQITGADSNAQPVRTKPTRSPDPTWLSEPVWLSEPADRPLRATTGGRP